MLAALLLAGCASGRRGGPPTATLPHTFGKIATVNTHHGFVLIDAVEIRSPGLYLATLTPEGTRGSLLQVGKEQRPPFLIADILEGQPQPGEAVVDAPPPAVTAPEPPPFAAPQPLSPQP